MRNIAAIRAYHYLKKRILDGSLKPGDFLSAQGLSRDIGLSRTPVKDALRKLEYDELVTIEPSLGAAVRVLDQAQFLDLLSYREALEVHAVGCAADFHRAADLDRLETVLARMRAQTEILSQSPYSVRINQRLADFDFQFHSLLFEMADNRIIYENFVRAFELERMMILSLTGSQDHDALKDRAIVALGEHTRIFAAVRDGDQASARSTMAAHLGRTFAEIVRRSDLQACWPQELVVF